MTRDRIEFPDGRHVPRPSRRKSRGWLNFGTKHPRCGGCNKQLWPNDDHSSCKEEQ